jgi:hypothetical protein
MSPENVGKISALARAIGSNFVVCHRWEEVWARTVNTLKYADLLK